MGSRESVEKAFRDIEDNQKALRESIEQSMDLAQRSERLIRRHRDQFAQDNDPGQAWRSPG